MVYRSSKGDIGSVKLFQLDIDSTHIIVNQPYSFTIADIQPLTVTFSTTGEANCEGETATIRAQGAGGLGGYTYAWDNLATTAAIEVAPGTYEVTVKVKAKRFETMDSGEIKQISINEPIKIGAFVKHPNEISKEDTILYLEPHQINKETMELKIIVDQLPKYITIDHYGTRSDENFTDNVMQL